MRWRMTAMYFDDAIEGAIFFSVTSGPEALTPDGRNTLGHNAIRVANQEPECRRRKKGSKPVLYRSTTNQVNKLPFASVYSSVLIGATAINEERALLRDCRTAHAEQLSPASGVRRSHLSFLRPGIHRFHRLIRV